MHSTSQSSHPLRQGTRKFLFFGRNDVGGTIANAKDVGLLKGGSGVFKRAGDVGGEDLDFFKFKLDGTTDFSARLENKERKNDRDPITLSIVDSAGAVVTGIDGKSLTKKNIKAGTAGILSTQLPAGTYYARLESVKGTDQNYKLRLASSALTEMA